ncbi:F-box/LRR-repeat protein, partial [Trifolium medium]|nr:F-box/LRR-repeat protein [Trifolium medium]
RDAALPLKTFHLHAEYDNPVQCPIKSITKWVNFMVQHGVEYLHLHGFSSVLLPSLKTLHLEFSSFPKLTDLMLFLSGCPILEDLHTLTLDVSFVSKEESLICNKGKSSLLSLFMILSDDGMEKKNVIIDMYFAF